MKKILFVGMTPILGGIDTFIFNIFMHLHNRYHFEFINTYKQPLAYSKTIRDNGGIIRHVFIKQNILRHVVRYHRVKQFFKKHHNYNLVYVNASTINRIYWIKAANKYGIRHFVLHSHMSSADKSILYKKLCKFLVIYNRKYLYNHKNIVRVAASKKCGEWMFGKNSPFKVINNGIDTKLFIHNKHDRFIMRKKLSIQRNDKVLITTSRLQYVKNYPKIINVFLYVHKQLPQSKLVIIGDGEKMPEIKHMVNNYNLNKFVYFLGNKDRSVIPKYLDVADLMLMPSFHEGMPYSLLESQAAGVPVLASTGIPTKSNITGKVRYLSLGLSNKEWSNVAVKMLNKPYNSNEKYNMNHIVDKSQFGLGPFIKHVDRLFSEILN